MNTNIIIINRTFAGRGVVCYHACCTVGDGAHEAILSVMCAVRAGSSASPDWHWIIQCQGLKAHFPPRVLRISATPVFYLVFPIWGCSNIDRQGGPRFIDETTQLPPACCTPYPRMEKFASHSAYFATARFSTALRLTVLYEARAAYPDSPPKKENKSTRKHKKRAVHWAGRHRHPINRSRLIGWLIGWLIDWLVGCFIDWMIGWLIDWSIDWSTHWLIDWWTVGLVDWFIDWSDGWLIHWLIYWMIITVFASYRIMFGWKTYSTWNQRTSQHKANQPHPR